MTTQHLSALTMLLSRHTRRREFITLLGCAAAGADAARRRVHEPCIGRPRGAGAHWGIHAGPACAVRLSWETTDYTRYRQYSAELVALGPAVILCVAGAA